LFEGLLGHKACLETKQLKITNIFYLKIDGGYTHMEKAKIEEKFKGNQKYSHILSHTHTTQNNSKPIIPKPATSWTRQRKCKKLAKDDHRSPL